MKEDLVGKTDGQSSALLGDGAVPIGVTWCSTVEGMPTTWCCIDGFPPAGSEQVGDMLRIS